MKTTVHKSVRGCLSLALAMVALTGVLGVQPASAQEPIAFSADEMLIDRPGTLINLARVDVDPSQVGQLCTVRVESQNQASVHNGNDLVITSGAVAAVIPDVEAEADATTDLSVDIVLGKSIDVDLRMGPDWVSSLGFALWLDCGAGQSVLQPDGLPSCTDQTTTTADDTVQIEQPTVDSTDPAGSADLGSVDGQTGCLAPVEPVTQAGPLPMPRELPILPPAPDQPVPCADPSSGSLSIVPENCPAPTAEPVAQPADPAPATAPTNPTPTNPTPAEPAPKPDDQNQPTLEGADAETKKSGTDPDPDVLGVQVERMPLTPAATAVPGLPTYNG